MVCGLTNDIIFIENYDLVCRVCVLDFGSALKTVFGCI